MSCEQHLAQAAIHQARAAMYEQVAVACQLEKARRRHMRSEGINRA